MTFESRRLHYFITVADTGSLGRAAEVLHVAQPALSRQMRLLEEAVGVSLLERSACGMTLTLAGAAYCQSARRLLEDGRAASLRAIRVAGGDIGDLRLGFAEAYAWHPDVLRALRQYRDECPGVTFTVEAMMSGAVIERVIDGHLDVGLAYAGSLAEGDPLEVAQWFTEDYLLAVPEDSPWAAHPPRRMAQLNQTDFVLFRRERAPHSFDSLIHHFHQRGFTPRIVQEGATQITVLTLVGAGLGCTVMPASAAHHLPPGVRLVPVHDLDLQVPVSMVWRRDNRSPLIARFRERLRSAT